MTTEAINCSRQCLTNGSALATSSNCATSVSLDSVQVQVASSSSVSSPTSATCVYFDSNLGYPKERWKTLQATLLALSALIMNLTTLAIIHDYVGYYVGRAAVPDVVFTVIPEQKWAWRAGDPMVMLLMLFTLLMCLIHRHRWLVWRRWMLMMASLYTLRLLSLAVTQLPASFEDNHASCMPALNRTDPYVVLMRVLEQLYIAGLQGNNNGYLCGDLMFSGHTVQFSLCCFMLHAYTPMCLIWFRRAVCVIALCGMVFMVISRSHYTVDILVAFWLTTMYFSIYHGYCEISHERRMHSSAFNRLWCIFLIDYFERNVPSGPIVNELQWPISFPRCCVDFMAGLSEKEKKKNNAEEQRDSQGVDNMCRIPSDSTLQQRDISENGNQSS